MGEAWCRKVPGMGGLPFLHERFCVQLPVFSANNIRVHVPRKARPSLAGVGLPGDAKGRSGHGPALRVATACPQAPCTLPEASGPTHSPVSASGSSAPDSATADSPGAEEARGGRRAGLAAALPTYAADVCPAPTPVYP